jgi:hypothetical protein
MPLTDKAKTDKKVRDRNRIRTKRYGNWRQHYCDSNGMCQGSDFVGSEFDGAIYQKCGETETLEFHEIYDAEGKVIKVQLLCLRHHDLASEHQSNVTIPHNARHYPSMLQEEVDREIAECGGVEWWKLRYCLY